MAAELEPAHEAIFVIGNLDAGDADLLKAELGTPGANGVCELRVRRCGHLRRGEVPEDRSV
jgi:hypothetical protein